MSDLLCPNPQCEAKYGPDDLFCEACGYDFITCTLPSADGDEQFPPALGGDAEPAPSVPGPPMPGLGPAGGPDPGAGAGEGGGTGGNGGVVVRVRFEVAVDRPYFDSVVSEGELDFPDPVPGAKQMEVAGTELHIGRTSESRAIHPDLDIAQLTGDPAVSSRHAVVRATPDGSVTVTDVGSTNGTFVGAVDAEAIAVGDPVVVTPDAPVYLGAWTRLAISLVDAG